MKRNPVGFLTFLSPYTITASKPVWYSYTEQFRTKLVSNIRKLRLERGLTQRDIAIPLGVQHSTIAHWESGRNIPEVDKVETIIDFLGYNPFKEEDAH